MTDRDALFQKWKDRLGLQDWCIVIYLDCTPYDFEDHDNMAETVFSECDKCALIRILREDFYGNRVRPFDFEKTLIHELLHLKLLLLDNSGNDLQDRVVHQLIDDLARAFVAAEREG